MRTHSHNKPLQLSHQPPPGAHRSSNPLGSCLPSFLPSFLPAYNTLRAQKNIFVGGRSVSQSVGRSVTLCVLLASVLPNEPGTLSMFFSTHPSTVYLTLPA